MTISKLFDLFTSPCIVTLQQAEALDQLSYSFKLFCEDKVEINAAVIGPGLKALGQIASTIGDKEGSLSWHAIVTRPALRIGTSLIVRNTSGDELSLHMDGSGQVYMGSYSNFMSEDETGHVITFDIRSSRKGRVLRIMDLENTTEVLLGDQLADGLTWTQQPDFSEDHIDEELEEEIERDFDVLFAEETAEEDERVINAEDDGVIPLAADDDEIIQT